MGLYIAPGSYQRSLENCNFLNQVEKKYVSRNNMVMVNYKTYTAIKKVSFRVLETRAYIWGKEKTGATMKLTNGHNFAIEVIV